MTRKILLITVLSGFPGAVFSLILICKGEFSSKIQWTSCVVIVLFWLGGVLLLRSKLTYTLRTLSNLLAALREGDYSIRGRAFRESDALGEVMKEVNALG